ncbi:MAG: protein-L-isoaspartate(D-aspartate) O-methyltransferase [Bacteroidetes bacterium]|nr:protein-L-isoaspartate(D-aspartate) O-methyltransferase [Bacteroidota bacterium]
MFKNHHPEDQPRHIGQRRQLTDLLHSKGIHDARVLDAIGSIPRHVFFPKEFEQFAYRDEAFPIGHGQTISQPYTVAFQSQSLMAEPGMKVLEIGTGSGYQAAVLDRMGLKVFSVEIIPELTEAARKMLTLLDSKVQVFQSDGSQGLKKFAPYDRILVTAGAPAIPKPLVDQLSDGGIMVIPVGKQRNEQKMVRLTKHGESYNTEILGDFRFVPLTGKLGWE